GPAPTLYARHIKVLSFDPAWPTTGLALGSPMSMQAVSPSPAGTDLLLLPCEGDLNGAGGETPSSISGVSYEAGHSGLGAYLGPGNQVYYDRAGNLDATSGSIEFWIKPRWNGNDNQNHVLLTCGGSGGIIILKDAGNSWKVALNRFGPGGHPEVGAL